MSCGMWGKSLAFRLQEVVAQSWISSEYMRKTCASPSESLRVGTGNKCPSDVGLEPPRKDIICPSQDKDCFYILYDPFNQDLTCTAVFSAKGSYRGSNWTQEKKGSTSSVKSQNWIAPPWFGCHQVIQCQCLSIFLWAFKQHLFHPLSSCVS